MDENTDDLGRGNKAVEECKRLEKYYDKSAIAFQASYFLSQLIAVVFSGITPILILTDNMPKYVQATPPAMASIAAGLSVYRWRSKWASNKVTSEALRHERINFEIRATELYKEDLSDDVALGNFRNRIMQAHLTSLKEWKSDIEKEEEILTDSPKHKIDN